jgi:Abortive infection C-terminus
MPPDVDPERLLAAAARRMASLGRLEAALGLVSGEIRLLEWSNGDRHADIYLEVGGDHFDALRAPEISLGTEAVDDRGNEHWVPPLLERVFVDVLPPGRQTSTVHVAIRNDPVSAGWREADEFRRLRAAGQQAHPHLDPSQVPTDSDLRIHLSRLDRLDQEPEELIGAAKDLVEATAKYVLIELGDPPVGDADVAALSKRALAKLKLHPDAVAPTTKGADTIRRILGGLHQMAAGVAELRNMGYGTGHGLGRRTPGLRSRHAELAARAAVAYAGFVLDTLAEPSAPWKTKPGAAAATEGGVGRVAPSEADASKTVGTRSSKPSVGRQFHEGDRVRHRRFGVGIVVGSRLSLGDEEVDVAFSDASGGRKTMLASVAGLERLGQA